jgi:transcriptional regulator with XRE-family HTH domain
MAATLGSTVYKARKAKRLTQPQLAHRSGVSERAIRDIESGTTRNPSTWTVKSLAAALDISAEKLVRLAPGAAEASS